MKKIIKGVAFSIPLLSASVLNPDRVIAQEAVMTQAVTTDATDEETATKVTIENSSDESTTAKSEIDEEELAMVKLTQAVDEIISLNEIVLLSRDEKFKLVIEKSFAECPVCHSIEDHKEHMAMDQEMRTYLSDPDSFFKTRIQLNTNTFFSLTSDIDTKDADVQESEEVQIKEEVSAEAAQTEESAVMTEESNLQETLKDPIEIPVQEALADSIEEPVQETLADPIEVPVQEALVNPMEVPISEPGAEAMGEGNLESENIISDQEPFEAENSLTELSFSELTLSEIDNTISELTNPGLEMSLPADIVNPDGGLSDFALSTEAAGVVNVAEEIIAELEAGKPFEASEHTINPDEILSQTQNMMNNFMAETERKEEKPNELSEIHMSEDAELNMLYKLVESEAGIESRECKEMVAAVVLNRVKSDRFPNSIYSVIYAPGAFSVTRNNVINRVKVSQETIDAVNAIYYGDKEVPDYIYFFRNKHFFGNWCKPLFSIDHTYFSGFNN